MQSPGHIRSSFITWRKMQVQEKLDNDLTLTHKQKQLLMIEREFFASLPFYTSLKDKIFGPLLKMQVSND